MTVVYKLRDGPVMDHIDVKPVHPASRHCGAVKFEVSLPFRVLDMLTLPFFGSTIVTTPALAASAISAFPSRRFFARGTMIFFPSITTKPSFAARRRRTSDILILRSLPLGVRFAASLSEIAMPFS
jgi:hypothetical protein